jgi:hypothetical protein
VLIAPGLVVSLLLGSIYGALAHLLWGRQWLHLPLFLIAGVVGCLAVWIIGLHVLQQVPAPGGLPVVEATVVAWLLLAIIAAIWRA